MKADELIRMTDAELTEYAGQGQEAHQMVSVAVARRLGKSVADFSRTAEWQATVMIWLTVAIAVLAFIVSGSVASVSHAASPAPPGDPFEQLKGDWKGGGDVILDSGEKKKVDCTTNYKVAGGNITQTLHCKGADYEINTLLKVTDKSGKIKGTWTKSYDASGSVTGTAKGDLVHAIISGDKFSGRMSINMKGDTHTINITKLNAKTGTYGLATTLSLHHLARPATTLSLHHLARPRNRKIAQGRRYLLAYPPTCH